MAILGYGSSVIGDNIHDIGEIQTVGFNLSADSADTTSTVSQYASGVPTTIKSNTIFISVLCNADNGNDIRQWVDEFKLKRMSKWRIYFPTGRFLCFGFVAGVTVAAPHDHLVRMDLTISLQGEPTFEGT